MTSAQDTPHHQADLQHARAWLTTLHGGGPGLINICATGRWAGEYFTTDEPGIKAALAYIQRLDQQGREGIYARVTTLRAAPAPGSRGHASDSLALPGFWADIDIAGPGHKHEVCPPDCPKSHRHVTLPLPPDTDATRQIVAASGLPEPTMWIHSGGGTYPWWLLDQPHTISDDLDDIATLTARWQHVIQASAEKLGYHYGSGVGDLARVLRVPGTVNRKAGLSRACAVLDATGVTYSLDELAALLYSIDLPDPAPPAARQAPPSRPRPATYAPGTVGPFDALAEVAEWRDLFEPYGLTYVGSERDGAQLWRRDGASSAYSVRAWPHVCVNHSDALDLPVGAGHRLTHGKVFSWWYHHGNDSAAAKDLRAAAAGDPDASPAARALRPAILDHIRQRCAVRPWQPPPGPDDVPWPDEPSHQQAAPRPAAQPADVRRTMAAADEHDILRGVYPSRRDVDGHVWTTPSDEDAAQPIVLPPFPVHTLPGDVGKFAEAVAIYMQVPVDLPAFAILGSLAALVGGHATITGKWRENALNLFLTAIADSGEGKSPAVGAITAPIYQLEKLLRDEWKTLYGDMADNHDIAVKTRDRLVAKIADATGPKRNELLAELDAIKAEIADTTPPPRPQLLAGDVTPEVLGKIMHRTGGHIAIISAEGGFLGTLTGRYSKGQPNLELVLTAFDSSEPYRLERITRDPFEVDRPSLSLFLAVQPVVINDAVNSPAVSDRGLLNRFLIARPDSLAGRRDKNPPNVPPYLEEAWQSTVHRVFRAVLPDGRPVDDEGNPVGPVPMQISELAEQLHLAWRQQMEHRVDPDSGDLAPVKGWAKKLEGLAYRLAALLHLAAGRPAQEPVGEAVMLDALTIADWAIPHALAVLGAAHADDSAPRQGPVDEAAEHVLQWIRRKGVEEFTVDEARAALRGRSWVKKHGAAGVRAVVVTLARQGWIASVERRGADGRRLGEGSFIPHPQILGRVV
ncbi:YfjI family protein [Nonomuraea pusilla]|uniref:YfjI family protein n=1 Tax=Nonomuraea pusilla TaxID=46177 RepID=UPI003316844F